MKTFDRGQVQRKSPILPRGWGLGASSWIRTFVRLFILLVFFFSVASFADDVHLAPVVGRFGLHLRRTRRMGLRAESNARPPRGRHHRPGVLPADFRGVPAASGLVEETDIQLDPLARRQRRPHIRQ